MAIIAALHIYPVKSCGGIALDEARISEVGLDFDRNWMLVDDALRFVSQREIPRLALVGPRLDAEVLHLSAPGMPDLEVDVRYAGERLSVTVWRDQITAYAQEQAADEWFTRFTGKRLRLVRFDPLHRRLSDTRWTGGFTAFNRFSDGYPILIISEESLSDLNARLSTEVPMNRFRPNLVVSGLPAYGEDRLDMLTAGDIVLKLVKPCARCRVVCTDQANGAVGREPLRTLATYRRDEQLKGATSFGQNAIVLAGDGGRLRCGQVLEENWRRQI
jgi:uncharacterized protein YcbX